MNKYECELKDIIVYGGTHRARIIMKENHKELGGRVGESTITSPIRSIDFERCIIVTRNSIYHWE